jgi:hypothetical protein
MKTIKAIIVLLVHLSFGTNSLFCQNTYTYPTGPLATFYDGELIEADYWDTIPKILSAGMGFADIVGIDSPQLTEELVLEAGGAWLSDIDCGSDPGDFTSSSLRMQVENAYIFQDGPWEYQDGAIGMDGLPIVFSWPLLTNTLDVTDFRFILNTGDTIFGYTVGMFPNYENNERNCAVIFGELGNRLPSDDPNARFPVKLEIVDDGTPLLLAGHNNQVVSAVGLSWETETSPYDLNNGPKLVGAKLNHVGSENLGEGTNSAIVDDLVFGVYPNDEFALYNGGDFRLRVLTSGGFSPDGVRGVKPTDFENFFRLHLVDEEGNTTLIETVDSTYQVEGGILKVLGLSDLGLNESTYNDCYAEDVDNYIDIILEGDEEAARNIAFVEVPSLAGGYSAFYNPGGPGTTPFPEVNYTSPGPPDLEPVIMALDDPMRVNSADLIPLSVSESAEESRGEFRIFPNPANSEVQVITEPNFSGQIEIYDLVGNQLLVTEKQSLKIENLSPGTYIILKKYSDGYFESRRFVKF